MMFTRTAAFQTTGPKTIEIAIPGTTEHGGNVMRLSSELHVDINVSATKANCTGFVRAYCEGTVRTSWTPTHVRVTVSEDALIIVGTAPGTATFGHVVAHPFADAEHCGGTVVVPGGDSVFCCDL